MRSWSLYWVLNFYWILNLYWILTCIGFSIYNNGAFQSFSVENGLPDNRVTSIDVDSNGIIWIGFFIGSIIPIRNIDPSGFKITLMMFLSIWICDTFAFIMGSRFGKKKLIPNKYRKPDSELKLKDVKDDQQNFEDRSFSISDEAFTIFYEDKSDYVQIGGRKGFFHLVNDKANLGTEKFHGNFILRFRAKRHTTKNFHSYSFFATLACKRVTSVSKYNIEETSDQKFPPIKP